MTKNAEQPQQGLSPLALWEAIVALGKEFVDLGEPADVGGVATGSGRR
jgi:hypothetical protein